MGGGAPLAFLNKKTWHPGRFQNTEEVWKREQAAAAEARKAEELRKQIEDERKRDEISQIAASAGIQRTERLDWMYGGAVAAKSEAQARLDSQQQQQQPAAGGGSALQQQQQQAQQPLSKGPAADEHLSRAERAARLPAFYATDTPASQNEQWARLNNDPLLLIRRQEQQSLQHIKQNPVRMQEILKEVEKLKSSSSKQHKKDKKHKKEHKKHHKREHKHHHHHHHHSSSSSSGDERGGARSSKRPAGGPAAEGSPRKRSRREPEAHGGSRGGAAAAAAAAAEAAAEPHIGWHDRRRLERDDRSPRGGARSRSRDRRHHHHDHHHDRHHDRQQEQEQRRRRSRSRDASRSPPPAPAPAPRREGYGLSVNAAAGQASGGSAAEQRAAATRQLLEEGARRREQQAREQASQRYVRRDYVTGRLSEADKAARLAEMMGNAREHDAQREARLRAAHAAEAAEAAQRGVGALLARAAAAGGGGVAGDAFRGAAMAEVYGGVAGGDVSLEARVGSRRHYAQRGGEQ